ncbi:MAG: ABC transporter permease subunit [Candidatus Cohnella colombiensis]|uniref:ABC transporter permease subunit n=1 Tax=Candidatus Cohnella colombiensis TaxID=3121368 RepID=A0AA95EVS5_9BACL|nr:MAG: ABC transporter permease subunit [Cohnella sp.]
MSASAAVGRRRSLAYMQRYWVLYAMLILPISFFIIFRYIPMNYIQIAFKKYSIVKSPSEMEWAANHGWQYFIQAFSNRDFIYALRNTLGLNLLDLVFGFPAPIILAIIFNELAFKRFKSFTQTIAYMPHFLSWIIVAGMALQLFAPSSGLFNIMLTKLGFEPISFLNDSNNWVITYIALGIWKSAGWGTILYLAAMAGINPELYEAASVDGAGRMRNIWHITLPGLRPTIIVLLILSLGHILGSEFDRPYALGNKLVTDVSNVISVFVYNNGIRGLQFSLSTAVGLFQSVVGVIFLFGANALAKKFGDRGIW